MNVPPQLDNKGGHTSTFNYTAVDCRAWIGGHVIYPAVVDVVHVNCTHRYHIDEIVFVPLTRTVAN